MKSPTIDNTLDQIRKLPEEVRFQDVAAFVAATPVVLGAGVGVYKILLYLTKTKYFMPFLLGSSTTLGLAVWLGLHIFYSEPGSPAPVSSRPLKPEKTRLELSRDNPFGGLAMLPDSGKKNKKIIRHERTIIRKTEGDSIFPDPPHPPLPPLQGVQGKDQKEIREEIRKVFRGKSGTGNIEMEKPESCGEKEPFLRKMMLYLKQKNLIGDPENFDVELTAKSLKVNKSEVQGQHLAELLRIYRKVKKKRLTENSEIHISRKKGDCMISMQTED